MHNPSEFGSNRCSVGAPVVLSDGLLGFRPLLATMILSPRFRLRLCYYARYSTPPLVIAGAMPPVSYTRPWFGFSLVEVGRISPNLLIPVAISSFLSLISNIFGSKLPPPPQVFKVGAIPVYGINSSALRIIPALSYGDIPQLYAAYLICHFIVPQLHISNVCSRSPIG